MSSAQGYRQCMRESLRRVLYQWKSPDTEIYMHDRPAGCRAYVYRPETKEMLVVQYDGSFGLQLFIASKPMTACPSENLTFCQELQIRKLLDSRMQDRQFGINLLPNGYREISFKTVCKILEEYRIPYTRVFKTVDDFCRSFAIPKSKLVRL